MQMVTHQHIGMNVHLVHTAVLEQQIEHALIIRPSEKDILAVVTPQDDMVRVTSNSKARESGHLWMVIPTQPRLNFETALT